MTITISPGFAVVLGVSFLTFLGTTIFCYRAGLFDTPSGGWLDLDGIFIFFFYLLFWIVPSLLTWALWATFA